MALLTADYRENTAMMKKHLRIDESFDLIERTLTVGRDELTLFYIDGFVKDGEMQRIMQYFFQFEGLADREECRRAVHALSRAVCGS